MRGRERKKGQTSASDDVWVRDEERLRDKIDRPVEVLAAHGHPRGQIGAPHSPGAATEGHGPGAALGVGC